MRLTTSYHKTTTLAEQLELSISGAFPLPRQRLQRTASAPARRRTKEVLCPQRKAFTPSDTAAVGGKSDRFPTTALRVCILLQIRVSQERALPDLGKAHLAKCLVSSSGCPDSLQLPTSR
ncbi:UNVERIFIED_CONTAM: hypothetical protein K2H54_071654 [Gekko kuhli]